MGLAKHAVNPHPIKRGGLSMEASRSRPCEREFRKAHPPPPPHSPAILKFCKKSTSRSYRLGGPAHPCAQRFCKAQAGATSSILRGHKATHFDSFEQNYRGPPGNAATGSEGRSPRAGSALQDRCKHGCLQTSPHGRVHGVSCKALPGCGCRDSSTQSVTIRPECKSYAR